MKKIVFLATLALGIGAVHAQTFKPFKVDLSIGYAVPEGRGSKAGLLIAVEPKYAVMDELAVGLRIEGAATARGYLDAYGREFNGDIKWHESYLATGDYFFSNNTFRPFLGAGMGLYRNAGAFVDSSSNLDEEDVRRINNFGFMLRGGFEVLHFRTGLEYNFAGNKNGYLGIKIGIFIGGGRLD